MASETLGFLANLSNSGAKLLLYFEHREMDVGPVSEIMRICGFGSKNTYYKAKSELVALGLCSDVPKNDTHVSKSGTVGSKSGTRYVPKNDTTSPKKWDIVSESGTPDKSWVEQAEDVDRLSGEGKREQQKLVVVGAWAEMFPDVPIHANTVAQFLGFAKWVCADVVGAMAVTQQNGIEGKGVVKYVSSAIQDPKWKRKATATKSQEANDPYADPENVAATYEWMKGKYGQQTADEWRAGLSA